ncbi:hypothetical protein [Barnesiella intestinihominis]|jgi:hypothetical protein|uniref:hypothetical protein n=1 Tax=Barnesiella intestinihominis TaxID=487174 RepID=UPI003A91FFF1
MKKLLLFFGALILLSFFACDKADKTDLHFIEYNLKNETDYYVQTNTSFLTSAGFYSPSYSGYRGLDINYYDKEDMMLVSNVLFIFGDQTVMIPQPAEYDTYTHKIDTIYPKQTIKIRIPIWDNHYRELPPYDSIENVCLLNPNNISRDSVLAHPNKYTIYTGKGYYCNSIDNSRIANKIDIRFIGKFCTGEFRYFINHYGRLDSALILYPTEKQDLEKTITETVDPDYSKNIIFK